jgi:RNA polymerase sigma-70 factor (ECF subfamily)
LANETPEWIRLRGARFVTTHWSEVLAAGEGCSAKAQAALEQLYRTYWYPVYAYLRRQGHTPEDAQDHTQELFARLLAGNQLAGLTRGKGRFRSYLLLALRHFLINERQRARASKRGGSQPTVPLDLVLAENRYDLEPVHSVTAETIFERRWALTLLDNVLTRLRAECVEAGREEQFDQLKVFLTAEKSPLTYTQIGRRLGLSEGSVKSAVSRLRQRYRELVQEEVARTVANPVEAADEMRHLFKTLSSQS